MKPWQIAVIVALVLMILCMCCLVGSLAIAAMPAVTTTPGAKLSQTAAQETIQPTGIATATLEPTISSDPHEALKAKITKELWNSTLKVDRLAELSFDKPEAGGVFVRWKINDNLTEDFITLGAQVDAAKILRLIDESGIDYSNVTLSGTFPMVDKYGNSSEENVLYLFFKKPTVDKINWSNFQANNIYFIADAANVIPQLRGDWKPTP